MEILLDGETHVVPDDATDDEIAEILGGVAPVQLQESVSTPQGYKEPPPMSERPKVEELSYLDKKLAQLPSWLMTGNKQLRGIAQGAADPLIGAAQLLANGSKYLPAAQLAELVTGREAPGADLVSAPVNKWVSDKEREYQAQRGNTQDFDWARLGGNLISPMNVFPASKLTAAKNLAGRMRQGSAIGGGYGAMTPVYGDDYEGDKTKQIGIGALSGAALPVITGGLSRVVSPKGNADVDLLNAEGIRTTLGQSLGGVAKLIEDKATSFPIVGDAIQSARKGGIEDFNKAIYNRVLNNFGEKLPKNVEVGQDALKYIHKKANDAYENVFKGGMLEARPQLALAAPGAAPVPPPTSYIDNLANLRGLVDGIPKEYQAAYDKAMKGFYDRVEPNTGNLSGEGLNSAMKHLRTQVEKLNNRNDGFWPEVRDALKETSSSLMNTLQAQNPELASKLSSARSGWHDYAILRDAASSTGARTDGIVSPNQLMSAVSGTAKKLSGQAAGKGQVSEGTARMQDLAGAAQRVLPSKYPDSGTAGRLALGLGAGSVGAAFMPSALLGAGAASLPYLPYLRNIAEATVKPRQWAEPVAGALRQISPMFAPALIPSSKLSE